MYEVPETAAEAAKYVERLAKDKGHTVHKYCKDRGVEPSIINHWRTKRKSYRLSTFLRLIKRV